MSDLAHKKDSTTVLACVCGSAWNYLAEGCSSLHPLSVPPRVRHDDIYGDDVEDVGFFECRRGHAFCGRH